MRANAVPKRADDAARPTLEVNGVFHQPAERDDELPVLWYLRDRLGLRGTKFGCGQGGCGACTIELDGVAVPSCKVTVAEASGKVIVTVEGLAQRPDHPIFRAWLAEQVPQCGYCQPGMIMATAALLEQNPEPSNEAIDEALSRVLCRCGSYQRVRKAVHRAAKMDWSGAPFAAEPLPPPKPVPQAPVYHFNPWVAIAGDGTVVVTIERSEMGQGVNTSLAMLVAEELSVDLGQIYTVFAPVDHAYDNPIIEMQITVGSMSMRNAWDRVRRAGAEVRERLLAAAAGLWNVDPHECRTQSGQVIHDGSGRHAGYGALAAAAAQLPPPAAAQTREHATFGVLGKPTARLEVPLHAAGRSVFGMDVTLPRMLAATMLFSSVIGARPMRIDADAAKAVHGVRDVFPVGDGIAIVADDHYAAFHARDLVEAVWEGGMTGLSTPVIRDRFARALGNPGDVLRATGDVAKSFAKATKTFEALYETPYLAHAPIEPINCTVWLRDGHCEVWAPTQGQSAAQAAAAEAAGLPREAVEVHTTFIGGGFGRRAVPDFISEAVRIAKRVQAPVQLVWSRADDVRHDRFRPAGMTLARAALDSGGKPVALFLRVAGPKLASEGIDVPYDIPNLRIESVEEDPGVPSGFWRSVGASQNAFTVESLIDELASAAGGDPVDFRRDLLTASPRHRAVLELAAEKAEWGVPSDCARGAAVYYAHGGWAAQIADVAIEDQTVRVRRVVCAVDCGFAINPDTIAAQIEGGVAYGLTAALKGEITIEGGRVVQSGFRDYPLLTIGEMPTIEVHIVPSYEHPSGVGECGVPPIAPAVANAVFAGTGRRIRRLPIRLIMPSPEES
jgi:isoquinoline 1-oxidoreductase subunit beta